MHVVKFPKFNHHFSKHQFNTKKRKRQRHVVLCGISESTHKFYFFRFTIIDSSFIPLPLKKLKTANPLAQRFDDSS